jgi:transcriptional regulator with XRE-family HTH domain
VSERAANPVDVHVGARVRLRRLMLRMSQDKLGENLGVTFQQIQKYERGANRVSASRLWGMADVLDVPVQYFFEGLVEQNEAAGFGENDQTPLVYDFINSTDGVQLAAAFSRITDPKVRRQVLQLVRALSGDASKNDSEVQ